mgnify:FL=1
MSIHVFPLAGTQVGSGSLTVIAGPCLAESMELCHQVAGTMQEICADLGMPYVFKASFDKANRTSVHSTRGSGMEAGLDILASVKENFGLPVTTDVHTAEQAAPVASVVDLIQVPAFLCRQSDLLEACAVTGKPVNVKKGQFLAPWDAQNIVTKLQNFGARGVMLTERGTSFGYNALVVDMTGFETMRGFGVPVCFDATHSAQRPGGAGTSTGGVRESIPAMARAATAVGIDAIFLEVHPNPEKALSDAATQWPLDKARDLLVSIQAIHRVRQAIG